MVWSAQLVKVKGVVNSPRDLGQKAKEREREREGKVGKENKGELNTGTEKVETATGASDKAEATADAPTDHDAEATADAPKDEEQAEPAKPKKVRGPRKETPKEVLTSAWGEKVGEPSFLTLNFVILCCWLSLIVLLL